MVAVLNGIHESKQAKSGISPAQIQRIEYKWGVVVTPTCIHFSKITNTVQTVGFAPPIPQQGASPLHP